MGAFAAGLAALVHAAPSLAATTTACADPPTVVPESPAGTALLLMAAVAGLGFVVFLRRRRGLAATVISTVTVVVLAGALLTTVLAGAATGDCSGSATFPGGVLAAQAQSSTPFTGADIPWITAAVLIAMGVALSVSARRRRG